MNFDDTYWVEARKLWDVNEDEYREEMKETIADILHGPDHMDADNLGGASGEKMWTSSKGKYKVKTLGAEDAIGLDMLISGSRDYPGYYDYITDNRGSFLPKFHDVFQLNLNPKVTVIVQENLISGTNSKDTWKYDLKGSSTNRTTEDFAVGKTGKDNNFGSSKIFMGGAEYVRAQLIKDAWFLCLCGIMDYSLFVCMQADGSRGHNWGDVEENLQYCCSFEGPGPSAKTDINLSLGIIDVLQPYTWVKTAERVMKTSIANTVSGLDPQVSVLSENLYFARFRKLVNRILLGDDDPRAAAFPAAKTGFPLDILDGKKHLVWAGKRKIQCRKNQNTWGVLRDPHKCWGSLTGCGCYGADNQWYSCLPNKCSSGTCEQ